MATYLSPGVYVEEKPGAVQPIAGVGTSTAGFIGFYDLPLQVPELNPEYDPTIVTATLTPAAPAAPAEKKPQITKIEGTVITVKDLDGKDVTSDENTKPVPPLKLTDLKKDDYVEITKSPAGDKIATIKKAAPPPPPPPAVVDPKAVPYTTRAFPPDADAQVAEMRRRATRFMPPDDAARRGNELETGLRATLAAMAEDVAKNGEVKLVTNFGEFKRFFGDFSTDEQQQQLAHAVFGFFINGGTRCWVARLPKAGNIQEALDKFEGIDEIALVAAPGRTARADQQAIINHCEKTGDRFAILDTPRDVGPATSETPSVEQLIARPNTILPDDTKNGAVYFCWMEVADPVKKLMRPTDKTPTWMPPSGHVAGVYARVDTERGVHKAPANEVLRGALDLRYYISKAYQDSLNPIGINCIRDMNGAKRIWGARTIGGDRNGEWKYVNVRRTFLYLRESIDEGTQWVVFEPNDRMLWGKIVRNVSAFLTNVWRDGALFGSTPAEAFYVKCDEETNPLSIREVGQVITEIGVALTKPAEFVIFRISQWPGPEKGK